MRDKVHRHEKLLRLVRARPLGNQQEIVALLEKEGVRATQASVSRDIRELGLVKLKGRYVLPDRIPRDAAPEGAQRPSELIQKVEPVGANLVVVRTPIGAASAVAVDLDAASVPDIVGTVAGDDTIFVAVRSRAAQGRVVALLKGRMSPR